MIEFIGWIALALGGAWFLGFGALLLATGMGLGGLETIPQGLLAGAITAIAWIAFVIWLSPLSITIGA